jgi:GT2 family glycosyltransferase
MARVTDPSTAHTADRDLRDPNRVDCGVIIVTYNNAGDLDRLLGSLPAATEGLRIRTVIVDNASSDGTWTEIQALDDVIAISAGGNLGYAGAINVGREHVGACESVLVLNADLFLEPRSVVTLFEALKRSHAGVAVPMILDEMGHLYPSLRREPTLIRALCDACLGARLGSRPSWMSETIHTHAEYCGAQMVEWASGAALMISDGCNRDVGGWDDGRFFLYSEETDFFKRARLAKYRCVYVPSARVRHRLGGSGRSPELAALMAVNRIRYYKKYHRRPYSSLFRAVVALGEILRAKNPEHRSAFRFVIRRKSWASLPGEPRPSRATPTAVGFG